MDVKIEGNNVAYLDPRAGRLISASRSSDQPRSPQAFLPEVDDEVLVWMFGNNPASPSHSSQPKVRMEEEEVEHYIITSGASRQYSVQYRAAAFNFVSRLMEHEGIFHYFAYGDFGHRMVVADAPGAQAVESSGGLRFFSFWDCLLRSFEPKVYGPQLPPDWVDTDNLPRYPDDLLLDKPVYGRFGPEGDWDWETGDWKDHLKGPSGAGGNSEKPFNEAAGIKD